MNRQIATFVLSALALAGCASAPQLPAVVVPEALSVPPDESKAFAVHAEGVQVYECRLNADKSAAAWVFTAPEATLTDAAGKVVGKHYAGPSWESTDGSKLTGKVEKKLAAPAEDSIPWLLLATTSSGAKGAYSGVTHIQRVATLGGNAPAGGCSSTTVGKVERVGYEAQYWFFTKKW